MHRRQFLASLAALAAIRNRRALASPAPSAPSGPSGPTTSTTSTASTASTTSTATTASAAPKDSPRLAITLDDPNTKPTLRLEPEARDRAILAALSAHRLSVALFVCGMRVDDEPGAALLHRWEQAGHVLANHSYSHLYFHSSKITTEAFLADLEKGEALVRPYKSFRKVFRYPFLKEGNTQEKRDAVRAYLHQHGYRVGHVTVDASDWYVDERLSKRLAKDPNADLKPYRDFYLQHLWERAQYYDDLSRRVLGRSVKHTLLVHHSLLNALFLGDVLDMFKSKGWSLVSAEESFADPVFAETPDIVPAGESLIWQLAKATGRYEKELRYPGEDGDYEAPKMDALGL